MPNKQAIKDQFQSLNIIPEVKEQIFKRLEIYSEELTEAQLVDFETFLDDVAVREEKVLGLLDDYLEKVENIVKEDDLKMEQTLDAINAKAEALKAKAQALAQ
jgi:hypothetical protein